MTAPAGQQLEISKRKNGQETFECPGTSDPAIGPRSIRSPAPGVSRNEALSGTREATPGRGQAPRAWKAPSPAGESAYD